MRIAVVMHLYYLQMYEEMKRYLRNFGDLPFDLYATLPRENMTFSRNVERDFPGVRIIVTENIGFDVYPFLCFLREVSLDRYDVIFKIHSKKDIPFRFQLNGYNLSGSSWRECLLSSIIGSEERVRQIVDLFDKNPTVGFVGAKQLLIRDALIDQNIDMSRVEMFMEECGLAIKRKEFLAGTMFAIRASLLQPIKDRNFKMDDFPPYYPRDWNGLPYCLERIFTFLVSAQGYEVAVLPSLVHIKKALIK